MITRRMQHGITMIEALGALAIASLLILGLSAMIDSSMHDIRGKQAALHQEQVVNAVSRFISISENYKTLVDGTADGTEDGTEDGTVVTITVTNLRDAGFLSNNFPNTNIFNQNVCALVRQPQPGKLDVLVVSYGGTRIPERDLPQAAMLAGQGGGYISTAAPGTARGASWQLDTTSFRDVACDGTIVLRGDVGVESANDGGQLVSSLFYDGPGQLATDFLYRNEVPEHPELNQMNTPIHMKALAVADATDSRCEDSSGNGKIAVDASGRVLSCQDGKWRRQGSGYWKDPVGSYAELIDLLVSDNTDGDVRMIRDKKRAFTWNEETSSWLPLAVDNDGNLVMEGKLTANSVQLNEIVEANTACDENGTIARDATGLILSCRSGRWRSPLTAHLTNLVDLISWVLTASDGERDVKIDLATLSGNPPLYLTGYATCHATGPDRAYAFVDMLDAEGNAIAHAGGCLSQLEKTGTGVQNLGDIALQKIPENVTHLHVRVEPGKAAADFANLLLRIYSE
jgi:hypothetical protein